MTNVPPTLWNQTAQQLLMATASEQPTPGGGSMAAMSGAYGAALVIMALKVSRQKAQKKGGDLSADGLEALSQLTRFQLRLQELADEDVAAFEEYMYARKLPKDTEEHKEQRRQTTTQVANRMLHIPYEVAELCTSALYQAMDCVAAADKGVVSDVGAGAALLYGAVEAALLTLDINIAGLEGGRYRQWLDDRNEKAQQASDAYQDIVYNTRQKIGIVFGYE